jgi:hypothetical protein
MAPGASGAGSPAPNFFADSPPAAFRVLWKDGKGWRYVAMLRQPCDPEAIADVTARKLGPGIWKTRTDRMEKNAEGVDVSVAVHAQRVKVPGEPRPLRPSGYPRGASEASAELKVQAAAAIGMPELAQLGEHIGLRVANTVLERLGPVVAQQAQQGSSIAERILLELLPQLLAAKSNPEGGVRGLQPLLDREFLKGRNQGRLEVLAEDNGPEEPVAQIAPAAPDWPGIAGKVVQNVVEKFMGNLGAPGVAPQPVAPSLEGLAKAIRDAGNGSPAPTVEVVEQGDEADTDEA